MKTRFHNLVKIQALLLLGFMLFPFQNAKGSEFMIMNRVISWDVNSGDAFWTIPVNANWPTNWLSPDDYYHGLIYTRYEVLSVATNEPFGMQFGIFQYQPDASHRDSTGELCELVQPLQGTGDIAINSSSPSNWWKAEGGVDFSRVVADLQSMSANIFAANPSYPVSPPGNGGDPAGDAWAQRFNWFPVTLRVTVVAVSEGSTFSGWDHYIINPSLRKPTPTYGIDYINETTDKVVPSTDEYSQYPTMSGAISGTGQKIAVPPGQVLYFRTKAGEGLLASEIQVLRVPIRPATPIFVLDKVNHRTTTSVSSDYEHCNFSDFLESVSGNGTNVNIPVEITKYFRKKATSTSFKSKVQALNESTKSPIAHEFVIFNDYAVFPNNTDTNGFYYFYYNADMPMNWKSPENYYGGMVYIRYEVISEKTTTPVGLQFGIWQMTPPETGELHETMSEIKTLSGPGAVVYSSGSLSVFADYWRLDNNLDFTRMNLTWHFGILPWKVSSGNQQIRQENPTVWAERNTYWFPMKVYVSVVAVASGYSFSGWSNYIGVKPPTPSYTTNYSTAKTNQVISSTDEYSYSLTMSPAFSGTNTILDLQPGQTVYFRTKAQGIHPASDIQRLIIPARPTVPEFTIDFATVKTLQNVAADVEYSTSAAFTTSSFGTGSQITVTPGQDLYFRMKVTESSFASDTLHLEVPAGPSAPSVTIDCANERTNEVLSSSMEYASNASMTGATACSNGTLDLAPGNDLYIRVKSTGSTFASAITALDIPARPSTPAITLDYNTENTTAVSSSLEWSENATMSSATLGTGSSISVTPGTDLYFRVKATASSFKSAIQHLIVAGRPSTTSYSINYLQVKTNEPVSASDDYATSSDMTGATAGSNALINLTPGTDLYFKTRATLSSFGSIIQHLVIPARPSAPVHSINYVTGTTNEPVAAGTVYSIHPDLSNPVYGTGEVLALEPEQDLYFKQLAGISSFSSEVFHLAVPGKNYLGYSGADTVTADKFVLYAILADQAAVLNLTNIQVTNGTAQNLRQGNVFDVYPESKGFVTVIIPANSIPNNSFASNEVTVYYDKTVTGISDLTDNGFLIYPNPSNNGIISIKMRQNVPYTIGIYSVDGSFMRSFAMNAGEYQQVNMQDLQKGIYFLKLKTTNNTIVQKLIIE
jgi:hypothetical protein